MLALLTCYKQILTSLLSHVPGRICVHGSAYLERLHLSVWQYDSRTFYSQKLAACVAICLSLTAIAEPFLKLSELILPEIVWFWTFLADFAIGFKNFETRKWFSDRFALFLMGSEHVCAKIGAARFWASPTHWVPKPVGLGKFRERGQSTGTLAFIDFSGRTDNDHLQHIINTLTKSKTFHDKLSTRGANHEYFEKKYLSQTTINPQVVRCFDVWRRLQKRTAILLWMHTLNLTSARPRLAKSPR